MSNNDKANDEPADNSVYAAAKNKGLQFTTTGMKAGQKAIVNQFGNTVAKTDENSLINKVFNKYKNADLDAFSMLDNASKAAGTAYADMKVNLELDQDDQLKEYQQETILNEKQFIMLKQDSKSISSIMEKIGNIPVEEQVNTLMASCEYEPPVSKGQVEDPDKDDAIDLVLQVEQDKKAKIEKQKERKFKLSQRELNEFIMATYPVITPE